MKYLPFLPVADFSQFVSLEEGGTPLIKSERLGAELGIDLYFKVEGKNPTGSFKDRGTAVEVTAARECGAKGIVVASTGNMAASCACYAAVARIPCYVFVPENIPVGKLAQVVAHGSRVVQVKGTYGDAAELAHRVAEEFGFYLAGDYAFRVEGAKTAAFEIVDQLFFEGPNVVVVPMGCGTNIASFYKGFCEYQALGLLENIPKLIGVQAAGASPIVEAAIAGKLEVTPWEHVDTTASAIAIGKPLDGLKASTPSATAAARRWPSATWKFCVPSTISPAMREFLSKAREGPPSPPCANSTCRGWGARRASSASSAATG